MSLKKTIILFLAAFLVLSVSYIAYLAYQFNHRPFRLDESIKIYPDTHLPELAHELQQRQLWKHPYAFVLLAEFHGFSGALRYGEYAIKPGMTPRQLLDNIHASRGLVAHSFRIHEGWTVAELMRALRQNPNIKFNVSKIDTRSLEGVLYPDTYSFAWGVNASSVIAVARQKMQTVLDAAWQTRDKNIPLATPYEALIVASLIQTEAGVAAEQPKIAAVIYNRLRQAMRLQIDPTVMFGLGLPYGSVLTKVQLLQKTPYNTYTLVGLPPTPIAFPTRTALDAAVHPAPVHALYYVAKGDGTHVFSDNYEQHKKAVEQYRALMSEQKWQEQKEAFKVIFGKDR